MIRFLAESGRRQAGVPELGGLDFEPLQKRSLPDPLRTGDIHEGGSRIRGSGKSLDQDSPLTLAPNQLGALRGFHLPYY